ncbi:hypothetical protein REPUB_Repub04eG0007600 [Reevesia pubescens]
MEFVALYGGQHLVGVSQRAVTTFYPVLCEKKNEIEVLIEEFFKDNVRLKFEYEDYTFDVYVTKDERVKLLDFNPWGLKTAVPFDYLDTSAGSGWDQFLRNADEELYQQTKSPEARA